MKKSIKILSIILVMVLLFSTFAGCEETVAAMRPEIDKLVNTSRQAFSSNITALNDTVPQLDGSIFKSIDDIPEEALNASENIANFVDGNYLSPKYMFIGEKLPGYRIVAETNVLRPSLGDIGAYNINNLLYLGGMVKIEDPTDISTMSILAVPKSKVTVSLDIVASSNVKYTAKTVDNTMDSVNTALNELFREQLKKNAAIPMRYDLKTQIINSEEDLNELTGTGTIKGKGNTNNDLNSTPNGEKLLNALQLNGPEQADQPYIRAVISLRQIWATAKLTFPTAPSQFFDASVTEESLKTELQNVSYSQGSGMGVPAVVSNVNYGRHAIITVYADRSKITESELLNKLTTSFRVDNQNIDASGLQSKPFNDFIKSINGHLDYWMLGGSNENNSVDITSEGSVIDIISTLKDQDMGKFAALPLSYTLAYLDGTLINVLPSGIYFTKKYEKVSISNIYYDGVTEIEANGTVNINDQKFTLAPADAILNVLGMEFTVVSGLAEIRNGIVFDKGTPVGDKIVINAVDPESNRAVIINLKVK